jgi:glutathione synthase/RimK-type ligase-like ATP-grasp enzyme
MRIALVTAAGVDVEKLDDRFLADALIANHGVDVYKPRWDEPALSMADWAAFDAVCLRSCWDYHLRYDEFLDWFTRADRAGVRWINPAPGMRWNSHKRYLLDLQDDGVPIAASRFVPRGGACDLEALLKDTGWTEAIVKPAVSASAYRTWRTGAVTLEVSRQRLTELLADGDAIIQRFVPEIVNGEWSLVFVEEELSHAVRKRPRAGDFRTQSELGAAMTAEQPSGALASTARAALRTATRFGAPCLTRLDLVETSDGPIVMEVELIEPMLFFAYAPGSAARAASALVARMARMRAAAAGAVIR